jgi:hypothetical protein
MLPFIEILNFHSHSNFSINIYVQERTTVEILLDSIYIVNTNKVTLINYSNTTTTPDKANLVIKDSDVSLWSPKTRFNILADSILNLNTQSNNANITDRERVDLLGTGFAFMINRANFKMSGFSVTSSFTNSSISSTLFYPIFIQDNLFELDNLKINVTGAILYTRDPLNFNANNLEIDYYKMSKGFDIRSECNYSGASNQTNVFFKSIVAYNSQERVAELTNSFINFNGPANFKLESSNISIFGTKLQNFAPIKYDASSACNPADSITQKFEIFSNTISLAQNSSNDRFTQIRVNILPGYNRKVEINIYSNTYSGLTNNPAQLHQITGTSKTTLNVSNMTMSSFIFTQTVFDYSNFQKISFSSVSLTNFTYFGNSLISISSANQIEFNNVTLDKCTATNAQSMYYIYAENTGTNAYVYLNSLVFKNTNLNGTEALSLNSVNNFTLSSSTFTNLITGDNNLLTVGTIGGFTLSNVVFTQISANENVKNYIINVDSILLNSTLNLQITGVTVSYSNLPFIKIDKKREEASSLKTLLITNFKYEHSYFSIPKNLLTFSGKFCFNQFNRTRGSREFFNSNNRFDIQQYYF